MGLDFLASKKAQGGSVLVLLLFVVAFAIFGVASYMVGSMLSEDIAGELTNADALEIQQNSINKHVSVIDNAFMFGFVLFVVFVIAASYFATENPMLFIIAVIMLVFVIITGIFLANAADDIFQDDSFSTYANDFTFIPFVINNLLQILVGVAFISVISMFVRGRAL